MYEEIRYKIKIPENIDIEITDRYGNEIGKRDQKTIILSQFEFELATLRSKELEQGMVLVNITPYSLEKNTGEILAGEEKTLSWLSSNLFREKADFISDEVEAIQFQGYETTIGTKITLPDEMTSGFTEYIFNGDITVQLNGEILEAYEKNNSKTVYRVKIDKANENTEHSLVVKNPHSGEKTIKVDIKSYFSSNGEYWKISDEGKREDEIYKKILVTDTESREWSLVARANNPELKELGNTHYDRSTGEILLGIRRGANTIGSRNNDEQITVNISNIPTGYFLGIERDGTYIRKGASDLLGTVTIFTKEAKKDDKDLNEIEFISEEHIYLVRENENVKPQEDIELKITVEANIPSEKRVDTRSDKIESIITIDKNDAARFGVAEMIEQIIDPVMIDFGNDGIKLTTINDGIEFEMIPTKDPLKTAWLSSEANRVIKDKAALLAYIPSDDNSKEIKNTSQLFSEYFQSTNAKKNWKSGYDALKSLDENNNNIINDKDNEWKNIYLWFDDGDGISQQEEIKPIDEYIKSIDLESFELITDQPNWAQDNQVVRKFSVKGEGVRYDAYDVGLLTKEKGEITNPIQNVYIY